MKRRKFVSTAGLGALGAGISLNSVLANKSNISGMKNLTASDVNKYLRSLIDVEEPSVDKIIIGDPGTRVKKIGTAWMPYWKTCKQAVREGVNVLIVHEPTFYAHRGLSECIGDTNIRNLIPDIMATDNHQSILPYPAGFLFP